MQKWNGTFHIKNVLIIRSDCIFFKKIYSRSLLNLSAFPLHTHTWMILTGFLWQFKCKAKHHEYTNIEDIRATVLTDKLKWLKQTCFFRIKRKNAGVISCLFSIFTAPELFRIRFTESRTSFIKTVQTISWWFLINRVWEKILHIYQLLFYTGLWQFCTMETSYIQMYSHFSKGKPKVYHNWVLPKH